MRPGLPAALAPLRVAALRRWAPVFFGTLVLTLAAKGGAFLPGYSIDDHALVLGEYPSRVALNQGRFGAYLLDLLIDYRHAQVMFAGVGILAMAALGVQVVRWWGLPPSWTALLAATMAANHPFTVEIFTFRAAIGPSLLPMAMAALLLVPRRWSWPVLAAGMAIFIVAMSLYQVIVHYLGMALLGGVVIRCAAEMRRQAARRALPELVNRRRNRRRRRDPERLPRWPRIVPHRFLGIAACMVLGTMVYMAIQLLAFRLLDVTSGRVSALDPSQLDVRLREMARTLVYRYLEQNPLATPTSLLLQQVLLAAAVAGSLWLLARRFQLRKVALAAGVVGLLAAGFVWSMGLSIAFAGFWPAPRSMAHVGLLWAAIAILAGSSWPRRVRAFPLAVGWLLVIAWLGLNNHVLQDQYRIGRRDFSKATRILARLEALPGFAAADQLAVDGDDWYYGRGFATGDMDMNISAFGAFQSKTWVLVEASGGRLGRASDPTVAERLCAGREPWPAAGSVDVVGNIAVVCLGATNP